jgi:hypothetical protein
VTGYTGRLSATQMQRSATANKRCEDVVMGGELTGDWAGFQRMLEGLGDKFKSEVEKATNENGLCLQRAIVETIDQQTMGGPPLTEAYVRWKAKKGHHPDKLDKSGALRSSIYYRNVAWNEGFVGVNRHEGNYDIGWIMEFGTRDGRVPARPYIDPSVKRVKPVMDANWEKAVENTFKQ